MTEYFSWCSVCEEVIGRIPMDEIEHLVEEHDVPMPETKSREEIAELRGEPLP